MNIDEQLDELLEIESALETKATKGFKKTYASLLKQLETLWPGDDASPEDKAKVLKRLNIRAMLYNVTDSIEALEQGAVESYEWGLSQGFRGALTMGVTLKDSFKRALTASQQASINKVKEIANEQTKRATVAIRSATTIDGARAGLVMAGQTATKVGALARYTANHSANRAIADVVSRSEKLIGVWVAERDACVRCLERQGETSTGKDESFNEPEHPNCRCTRLVLDIDVSEPVIAGLVREAQRSILRGFSLPSESNKVRIAAAKKLLDQGVNLPKSVKEYARKAVKRGEFPSGRNFPGIR
jgi:hypothetical protein